jgi:hypothetical protein
MAKGTTKPAVSLTSAIQAIEANHLPPSAQELQKEGNQKKELHFILKATL